MLVGFSYDHPSFAYRLFKFSTNTIVISRDVKFLNLFFGEYFDSKSTSYKKETLTGPLSTGNYSIVDENPISIGIDPFFYQTFFESVTEPVNTNIFF